MPVNADSVRLDSVRLRGRNRRPFVCEKMPSLRQLIAGHAPLLIIDAASTRIYVGAWGSDDRPEWQTSDEEAGIGIFQCLDRLSRRPDHAGAFVLCHGPGSILGIRTVAMAIRTWLVFAPRPVFAYSSLALVAHGMNRPEVGVIVDARRDSWHHYQLGRGLRRVPTADLTGELVMPERFRTWSPAPPGLGSVPYSLPDLLPAVADHDLFQPTDAPDAFLHEEPAYVRWTPKIHRAPTKP